jgi:hypothetical protein
MVDVNNLMKKLHSKVGRIVVAVILGLGIASLFRGKCHKRECIDFKGPDLKEIENNVYRHNNKCYMFKLTSRSCLEKSNNQVSFA